MDGGMDGWMDGWMDEDVYKWNKLGSAIFKAIIPSMRGVRNCVKYLDTTTSKEESPLKT
jgi:hypothetical protein